MKGTHMYSYEQRREANEASLVKAEHHAEIWEQHEVELLEEGWGDDEATLPEIAELLGRTIEACRQKHYELARQATRAGRTKRAKSTKNSHWDKGWTSLEDMGY